MAKANLARAVFDKTHSSNKEDAVEKILDFVDVLKTRGLQQLGQDLLGHIGGSEHISPKLKKHIKHKIIGLKTSETVRFAR
jgi:hypothetical protein